MSASYVMVKLEYSEVSLENAHSIKIDGASTQLESATNGCLVLGLHNSEET